jgi:hypothetical protein
VPLKKIYVFHMLIKKNSSTPFGENYLCVYIYIYIYIYIYPHTRTEESSRSCDWQINSCNGMRCGETFAGPNSPNKPALWTENWTSLYVLIIFYFIYIQYHINDRKHICLLTFWENCTGNKLVDGKNLIPKKCLGFCFKLSNIW